MHPSGQQQGPFPEIQLRELIARGTVTADTLVWTEGMAGWQKAGEIPGLMLRCRRARRRCRSAAVRRRGTAAAASHGGGHGCRSTSAILGFRSGRSLVLYVIGMLF